MTLLPSTLPEQKKNLRSCVNYIETVVMPLRGNFDINDKLCPDLVLNWDNQFTIVSFEIDSKLEMLNDNFEIIHTNVDKLRTLWQCYHLIIMGRITITKSILMCHRVHKTRHPSSDRDSGFPNLPHFNVYSRAV